MISCPLPGFAVRSKVRDGVDYRITVLSMDDYDNEERVTVSVAPEPSCHTDVRLTKTYPSLGFGPGVHSTIRLTFQQSLSVELSGNMKTLPENSVPRAC